MATSLTLRTIAAQSMTLRSVDPVLLVLGGIVAIIFSTTQWQNITSQTWEATTQTWD
jgi:hypothetical protein